MHLPFTVNLAPPTRADLRSPRFWALVALIALIAIGGTLLIRYVRGRATTAAPTATIAVTSTPPGATILVGDRSYGRTPTTLALPADVARLTLRLDRHADVTYRVRLDAASPASLAGILWPRAAEVAQVRPPLPGATIGGARFLADGRLALAVAVPPGDERQLWLADGSGGARRVGPPAAQVAIAVSPDGARVAYLARALPAPPTPGTVASPGEARVAEVWVTARDGDRGERRYGLPPNTADERLVDLAWSPDGAALLLASQQRPQGGGVRTRLLLLDLGAGDGAGGAAPRELIGLPSEVVPDSFAWSPRGDRVALLARAEGRTTLCVVGVDGGLFRSLADVADTGTPPPFAPLAWAPGEAGVVYAAPDPAGPRAGGGLFGATRPAILFADDLSGRPPRRVGELAGPGPCWRGDGLLVGVAQAKSRAPVALRALDPDDEGLAQDLGPLPHLPGTPESVRWSPGCDRALVALRDAAGGGRTDFWLVRWDRRDGAVAR